VSELQQIRERDAACDYGFRTDDNFTRLIADRRTLLRLYDDLLRAHAELEADARRLDWLTSDASRGQALRVQGSDERGWAVFDMADGLVRLAKAKTVREAIDAAIDSSLGSK
jgi:aminoglycoside phosphotransferase